jgi:acetylornithine/N-succinyldiaminopimelate aminotransferase
MKNKRKSAIHLENKYHFNIYNRFPITLLRGKGVEVYDVMGNKYIDALGGIAVNALGHCHPNVVKAIKSQAEKLIHVSNLYYNEPQSKLASVLTKISKLDKVFFCNSGVEAIEGAIKLTRKYAYEHGRTGNIVSMKNCFHGRTIAALAMGKSKYQKGFEPFPKGFRSIPLNNFSALEKITRKNTIGIFLEVVQGEGGIRLAKKNFLTQIRKICDENDIVLIFDEIQCGMGRTGKMFAYEHFNVIPDIITCAKALGGGFPIGAVLAREKIASVFKPGNHGTTFGGNPLGCAAACANLETINKVDFLTDVTKKGQYFLSKLKKISGHSPAVKEVRGMGLIIGVELAFKGDNVVKRMVEKGVLVNCTDETVIRFLPPLIIKKNEIDKIIDVLVESIKEMENELGD